MYGKLWSFVNHYIDADHALAVYLPILIVGWTIIGTLFGLGVCSAIRIDLIQSLDITVRQSRQSGVARATCPD